MADEKKTLNIFVTGGSEGAGLATVKALVSNGHKVVATTTDADGALAIRQAGALPVYPDLTKEGEILSMMRMANADVVVHAAPQIFGGVPQSDFDYASKLDWLVDTTNAVVHAAGKNEVDKIISISFGYLYDGHHGDASTEDAHTVHDNVYDAMLQAEAAVIDGGINGYVIRAGYIYGGYSTGTSMLADEVRHSRAIHNGKHNASWIHESDLASAVVALVEAESDGDSLSEIINVADDTPQSPNAFAQKLGDILGFTSVSYASPGFMTIVRGETLRDKLLAREVVLDTGKIKSKYGWAPQYATVEAGLDASALIWRMQDATDPTDYYGYEDKASAAIAERRQQLALGIPAEVEEEEEAPAEAKPEPKKAAPAKAESTPPASDGPTPWTESDAKMEERRRKALERKKLRAAKKGG